MVRGAFRFVALVVLFCSFTQAAIAGPITIDNGTAERLPKGKWDVEAHYGYYQMTVIKNTAYWGYTKGDGKMDDINDHDTRYINQVAMLEVYHGFTDRLMLGAVFPYVWQDVKKQPWVGGDEVESNGFSDILLRGCYNFLDPQEYFIGFSLGGCVVFPSGDEDKDPPLGNGRYELILAPLFTMIVDERSKLHVTLWYAWQLKNEDYRYWNMYSHQDSGDEFHYGIVGEHALTKRINLVLELNGWIAPDHKGREGQRIEGTGYHKIDITPGIQIGITPNTTFEAALKISVKHGGDFDYDVAPVVGIVLVF
jgi:hypothetical protein